MDIKSGPKCPEIHTYPRVRWIVLLLGLEAPKELNEIDTEVPYIVSPFRHDSVQDNTIERKETASYNRSIRFIKSLDTRDLSTLTSKKNKLKRIKEKYEANQREV